MQSHKLLEHGGAPLVELIGVVGGAQHFVELGRHALGSLLLGRDPGQPLPVDAAQLRLGRHAEPDAVPPLLALAAFEDVALPDQLLALVHHVQDADIFVVKVRVVVGLFLSLPLAKVSVQLLFHGLRRPVALWQAQVPCLVLEHRGSCVPPPLIGDVKAAA